MKFTVITPVYNGEAYIEDVYKCLLSQTVGNWQWIIIDDNSTDKTASILNSFQDERILFINNIVNKGVSACRNMGIDKADGDYLLFLDADDLIDSNFLYLQEKILIEKKCDVLCSSYRMINADGIFIKNILVKDGAISYIALLIANPIGIVTALVKRSSIGHLRFDLSLKGIRDDYAFWLDLHKKGASFYKNKNILASYRVHSVSVTANKKKLISKHFKMLYSREKIGLIGSLFCTFTWGIRGVLRFKLKL